ncbi:energy-coupling factor transport system permease protein [Clostridiales Family XIII bacterium PM5-7]
MPREGLGENSEFSTYHPIVNVVYFILTVGITMFSLSPLFLAATYVMAWVYSVLLKGKEAVKLNLIFTVASLVIMAVINTFFTHNGETVLFYINTNRITLEAFVYGIAAAIMLISVIIWFSCFNVIIRADKLIYLFGKVAPVLGLTLSMIFRFIPLLKSRFKEIRMGQQCMGRRSKDKNLIARARQLVKEISILIAWSLEASIESADSMESRGYGLRGRTSFHLFKFAARDMLMLGIMGALGTAVIIGCGAGKTSMYFYPKLVFHTPDAVTIIVLICYLILLALPVIIDITGEIKWKQLSLKD